MHTHSFAAKIWWCLPACCNIFCVWKQEALTCQQRKQIQLCKLYNTFRSFDVCNTVWLWSVKLACAVRLPRVKLFSNASRYSRWAPSMVFPTGMMFSCSTNCWISSRPFAKDLSCEPTCISQPHCVMACTYKQWAFSECANGNQADFLQSSHAVAICISSCILGKTTETTWLYTRPPEILVPAPSETY